MRTFLCLIEVRELSGTDQTSIKDIYRLNSATSLPLATRSSLIAEVKNGVVLDVLKNRHGETGVTDVLGLRDLFQSIFRAQKQRATPEDLDIVC